MQDNKWAKPVEGNGSGGDGGGGNCTKYLANGMPYTSVLLSCSRISHDNDKQTTIKCLLPYDVCAFTLSISRFHS